MAAGLTQSKDTISKANGRDTVGAQERGMTPHLVERLTPKRFKQNPQDAPALYALATEFAPELKLLGQGG